MRQKQREYKTMLPTTDQIEAKEPLNASTRDVPHAGA
jgi:hypothetical protein